MDSPWTASPLFSLPDESTVPMSYVREQILKPLQGDAAHFAITYATARYWAAVVAGDLPVPFRTGGASFHSPGTDTLDPEEMSYEPKRIKAGVRGLNRVTVFTRRDSPCWYIEWWEDGENGKRERVIRSLATVYGKPVLEEEQARMICETMSWTLQQKEAARLEREAADRTNALGRRILDAYHSEDTRQRAPAPLPNQEYAARGEEKKEPLPRGILEEGRDKTFGDLVDAFIEAQKMQRRAKSTIANTRSALNKYSEHIPFDTPLHLCTDVEFYDATGELLCELDPSSVHTYSGKIVTLFGWAHGKGWTAGNLLHDFNRSEAGDSRFDSGKYYKEGEEERILAELAKEDPVSAFIGWCVLDSGPRPAEVTCMKPEWFKLVQKGGREFLEMQVPKRVRKAGPTHTALIRTPEAIELFKEHIRPRLERDGYLFKGADRAGGKAASKAAGVARTAFNDAEARVGISHIKGRSLYAMKHRYVTKCIEAGRIDLASAGTGVAEPTLRQYYNVSERAVDHEDWAEALG